MAQGDHVRPGETGVAAASMAQMAKTKDSGAGEQAPNGHVCSATYRGSQPAIIAPTIRGTWTRHQVQEQDNRDTAPTTSRHRHHKRRGNLVAGRRVF